ncbi:conserved hypothetical protein [Nostocoides japonicum T1-X7]|uniref:Uncharacterized protein n=1 Tax=Nostocoides japonicum T1-X7 TaxID=1194083 RepID=A0A077LXF2_9MICO|nr:DUF6186 family protein [Tetrasphaera japonica]CCH78588.1 conserved hypothetical protein [Tetrasphaera japonica T1-X7]
MTWHAATVATYVVIGCAALLLELLGRLGVGTLVPLGAVVRRGLRHRSTQLGLLFAWWWLGWHFLSDR